MTAQIPERLIHRGNELNFCDQPLYFYLSRLPKARRPQFAATSSACWRGYVGTWEIRDDELWLVALEGLIGTPEGIVEATLETAFPWVKGALRASWVTGRGRCPEGRLVRYAHAAFASRYERDRLFDFERGHLVAEWLVLNPPEPIIYRIGDDGERICVENMREWENSEIPDPLSGHDVAEAHLAWGRPPAATEKDEGWVLGGAYIHAPGG